MAWMAQELPDRWRRIINSKCVLSAGVGHIFVVGKTLGKLLVSWCRLWVDLRTMF